LDDDAHVREGRERYGRRRGILLEALTAAGFTIDHSEAGLYLWARREGTGDCWLLVGELAVKGIIVGPGAFYGSAARGHVRISLTATDERVTHAPAGGKGGTQAP